MDGAVSGWVVKRSEVLLSKHHLVHAHAHAPAVRQRLVHRLRHHFRLAGLALSSKWIRRWVSSKIQSQERHLTHTHRRKPPVHAPFRIRKCRNRCPCRTSCRWWRPRSCCPSPRCPRSAPRKGDVSHEFAKPQPTKSTTTSSTTSTSTKRPSTLAMMGVATKPGSTRLTLHWYG